jgi:hypothetical protein
MPNNIPPSLVELNACKIAILQHMQEMRKVSDFATKELATMQAALDHIEQLINDFDPTNKGNKDSSGSPMRKSAA